QAKEGVRGKAVADGSSARSRNVRNPVGAARRALRAVGRALRAGAEAVWAAGTYAIAASATRVRMRGSMCLHVVGTPALRLEQALQRGAGREHQRVRAGAADQLHRGGQPV